MLKKFIIRIIGIHNFANPYYCHRINNNNFAALGRVLNVENCEEDEYQNKVTLQYKILNPIELSDDFIQDLDIQE